MRKRLLLCLSLGALSACTTPPDMPVWLAPYEQDFRADPDYHLGRDIQNDHWLDQIHQNNEAARGATIDTEHH